MIEGVHQHNRLIIYLVEYVTQTTPTHKFSRCLFHKSSIYKFSIGCGKFRNDIQNKLTFVEVVRIVFEELEGI